MTNRAANHTKLLSYDHQQVSAMLFRDADDELAVMVQLWVNATDEQLRGVVTLPSDEDAQAFFEHLADDTIEPVLEGLGLLDIITEIS